MRWTDNPGNEAQFVISRCAASSFSGDVVTYAVAVDTTCCSDTTSQLGLTTYYYRINEVDAAGVASATE